MNALISVLRRVDSLLGMIKKTIAVVLSVVIVLLMVLEVITRYVFGEPFFGLEELTLISVMWLYMIGASMASRERSHLKADIVQFIVRNDRALRVITALATLIALVMAVMIAQWSFDLMAWGYRKQQTTPVFAIPWVFSQSSLFFGSLAFVLYLARDLFHDVRSIAHGDPSGGAAVRASLDSTLDREDLR